MVLVLSPFTASDAQQTSQISSYEVTVPRRISRQRRNQESSEKVSYVIQARGKERVVILERNEYVFFLQSLQKLRDVLVLTSPQQMIYS
ncbi:hypothetical protein DNTS_015414 [Danionella cerebrum]|uniref:Uncharacterized protein n=1 Tax=Danionella cerebrum TaxID=2873325 RepID=A0A553R3U9_9TELE|nr:hypothetical protein DNTS_015414 [Danionella translucida]